MAIPKNDKHAGEFMHSAIAKVAILALVALLGACGDQATSATNTPNRPVQVQRVAFQTKDTSHEFVGVVRARYETDVGG
jgi:hypothetical protein